MAYAKTEKVLAGINARRSALIASAIDIITRNGVETLTSDAVVEHAGLSIGLFYKHFPDKVELIAAIVAQRLERDLALLRDAAAAEKGPGAALVAALLVFYASLSKPRLTRMLAEQPTYRLAIRAAIERMIRAAEICDGPKGITLAAAGALGVLFALADLGGPPKKNAQEAVLFALRGIGLQDGWCRREIEKQSQALA